MLEMSHTDFSKMICCSFIATAMGPITSFFRKLGKLGQLLRKVTITLNGWTTGEGGPPRALKAPLHPYTRTDCERMLNRKLKELR